MDAYPRVYSQRYVSLGDIVDIMPIVADYLDGVPYSSGPTAHLLVHTSDFISQIVANGASDEVVAQLDDIMFEVDCNFINVEW
jgi:hypothetical protein